jgi:hypothetical protein
MDTMRALAREAGELAVSYQRGGPAEPRLAQDRAAALSPKPTSK